MARCGQVRAQAGQPFLQLSGLLTTTLPSESAYTPNRQKSTHFRQAVQRE